MQIRGRDTARAHVGGLRVPRPGRSTYPDGNLRTADDVYMRRELLLVVGEKCRRGASGKREIIIVVCRDGTVTRSDGNAISITDLDFSQTAELRPRNERSAADIKRWQIMQSN